MCVCMYMGNVCVTWNKNTVLIQYWYCVYIIYKMFDWYLFDLLPHRYIFPFFISFRFFFSFNFSLFLLFVFPCLALKSFFFLQKVTSQELINIVRFHAPFAIIVYILNESNMCLVVSFLFLTRMTKIHFKKSGCDFHFDNELSYLKSNTKLLH